MDPSLVKPQPHLTTYGVLKETIKTTSRNGRLAISIILFIFLSTFQLEFGSRLALRPILEDFSSSYWPVQEKITSFQARSRVSVEAPSSPPRAKRNIYYSYQRANPSSYNGNNSQILQDRMRTDASSYNGYMGRTKQVSNRAYSSQGTYPSSYNGYTGQTKQAVYRPGTYSYQRAYPSSYNGYTGQNKQASSAYSYQRAYPSSYNGYMGQNKQASSAYSYQRDYPSSYNGYVGLNKQASSAYSYQRDYPSSYNRYTDQNKQASNAYSYQRAYPSSYNGYTGRTKQASSAYSYQRDYPSSYDRYTDQNRQASSDYSYQRAYPSSYNGYTGRTKQASSAYSYQRAYPSSYNGYTGQTKQVSNSRGAYSYERTNPSSYGYKDQTKPMGEQKRAYSYHQAKPTSYSYMGETKGRGKIQDVRVIFGMYSLILVISCVIFLFFLVSTISSSYEAYTAKVITLKDVFLKFRECWKRTIHTGIWLTLISSGFFGLLVFSVGLITLFTEGSSTYVLFAILFVPGTICYFHLAALWMMTFVVSVLESDFSGLKAIVRAGELMKGKRHQAYLLIVIFNIANASVNTLSSAYSRKLNKWAKMNITMPFVIGLICVIKLLMFVAFTVYYHERKMNQKEEKVEGKQGLYVPIASDEV